MSVLGDRICLKEIQEQRETEDGLALAYDDQELPEAEVALVSEELSKTLENTPQNLPKPGDRVLYIRPRERGRVRYKEEDHFIVPYSAIVAIL
jgi:co-chaperonin GroES (HSP10)